MQSGTVVIGNKSVSVLSMGAVRAILRPSLFAMAFLLFLIPAWPQAAPQDLGSMSLDDLMNTRIVSVSKTTQSMSRTASAVFVITAADIAQSGATNIPDLLRIVPGVDVAQIDANTWAVSARGLNGRFSNELLVMVDGRNVYTPTFGGVFWDVLDVVLEDIERIEVIRGPGATIWGANAVNGVINIITKHASASKGGMVVAGGGIPDQSFGVAQYGGELGKSTDYRVFAKYSNQSSLPAAGGGRGADGSHMLQGGFRTDSRLSEHDSLMIQGDLYNRNEGVSSLILPSVTSPELLNVSALVPLSGGFIHAAWDHTYSANSDTTLQVSWDGYKRDEDLVEQRRTLELEFSHHFAWRRRQEIVWGVNYRNTDSETQGSLRFSLQPANLNMQLFSLFVQDEVALVPYKLYLTAGAKLGHNYYTGFNVLPSVRAAWTPSKRHMFWAAVSRADRTPAEIDTASRVNFAGFQDPGGPPTLPALVGNPRFGNEGLTAFEAGYRGTLRPGFSVDIAAYYSLYDHQQTTEPAAPFFENSPAPPHLVLPMTYQNLMHGEAHGVEISANWKVTNRWTLSPGYAFERVHMHLDPRSTDTAAVPDDEGTSPVHSAQLRSHLDLRHGVSWDVSGYFVDRLTGENIPSYTRLDTGLTWRWTEGLSTSVVGRNLIRDRHLEFTDDSGGIVSTRIKRSVYAKFTWLF